MPTALRTSCKAASVLAAGALAAAGCASAPRPGAPLPAVVAAAVDTGVVVDGHRVQAVRLQAAGGLRVDLLVKRPDDRSAGDTLGTPGAGAARRPLVLVLGGQQTGSRAARLIPDTRGRVVAALAYPYDGPAHPRGVWGAVRAAPAVRRAAGRTPQAVRVALDWLLAQPYVDPVQVDGVGASLGVPYMVAAAAQDPRIGRVWALHGGGRSRELIAHNAPRALRPRPVRAAAAWAADRLLDGPRLTPERWAAGISPRPFVMLNAEADEKIPRHAALALYEAAREPKALVWLPGPHLRPDRPEVVRALVGEVLARMDAPAPGPRPAAAGR